MNRKIEIEFIEDAAVEIRAVNTAISATCGPNERSTSRRSFRVDAGFGISLPASAPRAH